MAIVNVTEENFKKEVLDSDKPVLVDFNAIWCGPCRAMAPILHELAESETSFKIASIDIDRSNMLAAQFGIAAVPTLVLFDGGKEARRNVGLIQKDAILQLVQG